MTEMTFNEWEKKIMENGGDVLCIAEAFLLAQYSDFAYHKVDACIERFVDVVGRRELRNPPGWLHMAIEWCRRDAENEVGMQADYADRKASTRRNVYHQVADEYGWDSSWRPSKRTSRRWVEMRDE